MCTETQMTKKKKKKSQLREDPEIKGSRLREQKVHFYRDISKNLNFNISQTDLNFFPTVVIYTTMSKILILLKPYYLVSC